MTKRLRVDPEADEELSGAARWYEERRAGLGAELLDAVRNPRSGATPPQVDPELGVRRVLVRRFPYAVVYLEMSKEIRVLAFAHASRRPGYWRDR